MRTRIISAIAVAPVVIGAVLWPGGTEPFPGWPFALLVLCLGLVAVREFYNGCRRAELRPNDWFGWGATALFILAATPLLAHSSNGDFQLTLTLLLMASLAYEALRPDRAPLKSLPATWLGALYVGWLFSFAVRLRLASAMAAQNLGWSLPQPWMEPMGQGAWLLLFTLVTTSAVDTGAYFVGKGMGKHKLAPVLSPGKTLEGSVGGFVVAVVFAGLIAAWIGLPLGFALTAAALIGIVAQVGDLTKSAMKREIGVKDFGTLMPGHGGVLDRFDSLLFTAPTVYWLLALWR